MKDYDHIFIVTNDLTNERRVKRIIDVIVSQDRSVLLIGRQLSGSIAIGEADFDQHRVKCVFNSGPLFYLEFYLRVTLLILRRFNAEHITCNDLDTILIGKTLKRFRKFHLYLDCHEWFEEVPELQGKPIKKGIWTRIAKHSIPATDTRYTVNSLIGQQMAKVYNSDFEVIQNISPSVNTVHWHLKEKQHPFKLVYLGVLNEGRGLEHMIKAMEYLDGVELDIIGDGDIADKIKRLVYDSPARDRITLNGSLSPEAFVPLLHRSHLGVNLLESRSKNYYYSSANKLHDYINHGMMVLTMNYPYYARLAQSCNAIKLIDELDATAILQKIKSIIRDYDLNNVVLARTSYLDKYNWDLEVEKLSKIYFN